MNNDYLLNREVNLIINELRPFRMLNPTMYICDECGSLVEESEIPDYYDCHCGGTFVLAKKCDICGEWVDETIGFNGSVCIACFEAGITLENSIAAGRAEAKQKSEPYNSRYLASLTVEEIDKILLPVLKEAAQLNPKKVEKETRKWCLEDADFFADFLVDQKREQIK